PTPGFDYGVGRAINESGQAVGFMFNLTGEQIHHAFSYKDGVTTDLGTLGGKGSQAYGLNGKGQVIGLADTASGEGHAFLWTRNQMIDLGTLGGESFAYGINNSAQVVGYYLKANGDKRPFLWEHGYMIDLGDFGGPEGDAWGINESGQVAGYASYSDGKEHAYLYSGGQLIDIGVLPGGDESFAYNINNLGAVGGASKITGGVFHAFVYSGGQLIDLNTYLPPDSDWNFLNYAMAISDDGRITGYGFKKDLKLHAFLLTPDAPTSPEFPELTASDQAALVQVAGAPTRTPLGDDPLQAPSLTGQDEPLPQQPEAALSQGISDKADAVSP